MPRAAPGCDRQAALTLTAPTTIPSGGLGPTRECMHAKAAKLTASGREVRKCGSSLTSTDMMRIPEYNPEA
jgi:hypothetical protein